MNLSVLPAGEIRRSARNRGPGHSNGSKPGRISDRVAVTTNRTNPQANQPHRGHSRATNPARHQSRGRRPAR
jgi:hypothetical protein